MKNWVLENSTRKFASFLPRGQWGTTNLDEFIELALI